MEKNATSKSGWKVLIAGLCINLTLGVLYSWSVIKKAIVSEWGWTNSDASLPYTVAIVVWAITLLFAGRLQDKIGPRKVVTLGAIFTGLGLVLSSFIHSVPLLIITFAILAGGGIGFAYASVTPPALKWFHPSKKGMVVDATGTFDLAYIISAVLLVIAFIMALLTKPIAAPKES